MRSVEFKKLMILDGYNVIHKLSSLANTQDRPLRERRNALIAFLRKWQTERSFKGQMCVVFDGRDGVFPGPGQRIYNIDCFFTSSKEEADDRIIAIIRKHPAPDSIVVVSDDNYVRNHCKVYSVDVQPVMYLMQTSGGASPSPRTAAPDKKIDLATQHAINQEMKKKWGIE